ncbi:glycoside hydrolase family 97 protein [Maribellus comscasis]|uniref:Glycoside hydrolase family 97 protein n=1 Tax=Maribellus comscasis TaxID=2681766 RepID=A0A6I6K366_9BACT|nr:glycoside hydrolase family 97 protein [Maribellus comscasis]QGY44374.1 glycoside hydrolase family 97 protein [Maribellus comscasis]
MKKYLFITLFISLILNLNAKDYTVSSPSGELKVTVSVDEDITYAVSLNGKEIITPSAISMKLDDGLVLGENARVRKTKTTEVNQEIIPVVNRKHAQFKDHYNLITLSFKNYSLEFKVYNDGVAYRWGVEKKEPFKVVSEQATFAFPANHEIWFPEEESMFTHQERVYERVKLSDVTPERFCSTGMLVDCGNNTKVYISESDLMDYPGMFLKGSAENTNALVGKYPGVVLETKQNGDRNVAPTKYADYIAECKGTRTFPWRAMIITNDAGLVESEMIYKLAPENVLENTNWIKPGKVAWDWWNANNIYGIDFESGVNNNTYKYYIDFASKYGLEYIILDEGWYHLEDIMDVVDDIDIQELVDYGKQKNVGVILWVVWKALDDKLIEALDQFQEWGVKGIKIDFMQRDDQWMVNFYEKIARECAKRELLVDYHGAYKPSGLDRKYPNVISYEGVKGLENAKWSNLPDPEHNVTLPFTRMVAGPMDFTPGAMLNANKTNFNAVFTEPMSPGTRCHQLGMYVVFESPLQMLADNPSNYYREPECMEFLEAVPAVWDDTKVLEAKVSDYIAVARKSGDKWFVGAMTDWDPRTLNLDLSFLGDGNYTMEIWKDGVNADKHAADFSQEKITVSSSSKVKVEMAPGGGWVAVITKK